VAGSLEEGDFKSTQRIPPSAALGLWGPSAHQRWDGVVSTQCTPMLHWSYGKSVRGEGSWEGSRGTHSLRIGRSRGEDRGPVPPHAGLGLWQLRTQGGVMRGVKRDS